METLNNVAETPPTIPPGWWQEDGQSKEVVEGLLQALGAMHLSDLQPPDPKLMEDLLKKDEVSFEEQERAAFDVHGLSLTVNPGTAAVHRTTALEEEGLVRLDKELKRLGVLDATNNNPLVRDPDYRLMFLRCDDLDAKVAAQRIQRNLEVKKKLFGHACLHRDVERSDLNQEDLAALESGHFRVAPNRDAAGRVVLFYTPSLRPLGVCEETIFRSIFYFASNLMKDQELQRVGVVVVALLTGAPNKERRVAMWKEESLMRASLPRKIAAIHYCMDTSSGNDCGTPHQRKTLMLAAQMICRPAVRKRFRSHVGLRETIHFQLQSYGITLTEEDWPVDPIPVDLPSSLMKTSDDETMDCSDTSASSCGSFVCPTKLATTSTRRGAAIVPTKMDVLLGRGKRTRNHPGNIWAAQLVHANREQYETAKKTEKTAIAERIVHTITASGGRFLKQQGDGWVQVTDSQTARNKISHLYRNTKKSFLSRKLGALSDKMSSASSSSVGRRKQPSAAVAI